MYYVIQQDLFKEYNFKHLIEYLTRYGLEYELVKFRPFGGDLNVKTKRKDIWFFGSVSATRSIEQMAWNPGSLYNDSHDFEAYGYKYGKHMLNSDAIIINAFDPLPDSLPFLFFARPTKDTKMFSGQVFTREAWNQWMEDANEASTTGHIEWESKILVAPEKYPIQQEIRCWIVDGEVVTISQYKIGNRVNMLNMDNNEEAIIFAKDICKIYCPAKAFVLDICLYEDEYKVVEINCVNCSGFYDADMSKLIQALEKTFN